MDGIKHQRAGILEGPQSPKKYSGILETMGKWLRGWQKSAHRHSGISGASRGALGSSRLFAIYSGDLGPCRCVCCLNRNGDRYRQYVGNFRKCSVLAREWRPLMAGTITTSIPRAAPACADAVARRRPFRPDVVASEVTSGG